MISPQEVEKIQQFRSVLQSDLLTKERFEDDYYLIRWLRARNMDIQKAADMLEKSMKWRKEIGADEVNTKEEEYEIPMKYRKIYPTGFFGTDEEDCLVAVFPLGRFQHRIFLEGEGMETGLRYNMLAMERMMRILTKLEKETGKKGLKVVELVDMEFYTWKELMYRPAREYILESNRVFDENYPELLKSCIVINAPKVFTLLWNMIKPFLSQVTAAKVQIYGQDEKEWKEMLRTKLKPDKVPKRYGGTREGSDDFCSQDKDVWIDAPIPLNFFTTGQVDFEGLKTEKIKARDKLVVEIPVESQPLKISPENRSQLYWKFKVDSHDINFSVIFKPNNSQNVQVVYPECKVDSKQGLQEGSYEISGNSDAAAGMYNLIFDNRYSYTRSKTVQYSAQVEHFAQINDDDNDDTTTAQVSMQKENLSE